MTSTRRAQPVVYSADLVRVGIDPGRALGGDPAAVLVRTAPANQILREVQALQCVSSHGHRPSAHRRSRAELLARIGLLIIAFRAREVESALRVVLGFFCLASLGLLAEPTLLLLGDLLVTEAVALSLAEQRHCPRRY